MRDIGDGHDQPPPAIGSPLGVYGIVEVPRIGAIDGDQRQGRKIQATGHVALRHAPGRADVDIVRPVDRYAVAAQQRDSRAVGFVSCEGFPLALPG